MPKNTMVYSITTMGVCSSINTTAFDICDQGSADMGCNPKVSQDRQALMASLAGNGAGHAGKLASVTRT
jgi:hypothetical protein